MTELAEALLIYGEQDEAKSVIDLALKLANRAQAKTIEARLWSLGGSLYMEIGKFDAAEELLMRALAAQLKSGLRPQVAWIEVQLSKLSHSKEDRCSTRRHLQTAYSIYKELDVPIHVARIEDLAKKLSVTLAG